MILTRVLRLLAATVLVALLASCGGPDGEPVAAGGPAPEGAAPAEPSVPPTSTGPAPSTTAPVAATAPPAVGDAGGEAPGSSVEGLSAADVRAAVEAPVPGGTRAAAGPTAEAVRLPGGATVWRVRIPGRFPVRSARVTVLVGGRTVGEGTSGPGLSSLVAVTTDRTGLVAGAAVSYRWDGREPVAAGRLVVAR